MSQIYETEILRISKNILPLHKALSNFLSFPPSYPRPSGELEVERQVGQRHLPDLGATEV